MPKTPTRKQYLLGGAIVMLLAVGMYGILPRFGDFKSSLSVLSGANVGLVVAATCASLASAAFSALIYQLLSLHRLRVSNTMLVQYSGLLVNRVLPAGVGGLGLNYLYLRKHRHTVAQASSIVALNNGIGFMGHMLLALGLLVLLPNTFVGSHLSVTWLAAAAAVLIVVISVVAIMYQWRPGLFHGFYQVFVFYTKHPSRLLKALSLSFALTLSNVLSLWLCCAALGVSLSFLGVFVSFTLGVAIGTATPTPGGLGGVEAALVSALVVQGVPAATALAIALLYRLVSYWFGLLVGAAALAGVTHRKLLM